MSNAVYWKTIENFRNRINVTLLRKKNYFKWTSKPGYKPNKIFNSNLVAPSKNKVTLTPNKVAYLGMCILELSKVLMYEFYYDYFNNNYGNTSRRLFAYTDSLMYQSNTEDVYED